MLDYRYKTFLDLVETKNYTKTAQRLNFSQPAVTKHIQSLETKLGTPLVLYEKRKLIITEDGLLLHEFLLKMSHEIDEFYNQLNPSATLTIGSSKTVAEFILPETINQFSHQFPSTNVSLKVENTPVILEALKRGEIDLALVTGQTFDDEFEAISFMEQPIKLVCSPKHSLAKQTVDLETVFNDRLILREKGAAIPKKVTEVLNKYHYDFDNFKYTKTIGNISIIKNMVKQNEGVGFMYDMCMNQEVADGSLCEIHLKNIHPMQTFYFVKQKNKQLNSMTCSFLSLFDQTSEDKFRKFVS